MPYNNIRNLHIFQLACINVWTSRLFLEDIREITDDFVNVTGIILPNRTIYESAEIIYLMIECKVLVYIHIMQSLNVLTTQSMVISM